VFSRTVHRSLDSVNVNIGQFRQLTLISRYYLISVIQTVELNCRVKKQQ